MWLEVFWRVYECGVVYVDCEAFAAERFFAAKSATATLRNGKIKIILSLYNYDEMLNDEILVEIYVKCVCLGVDIVKMVLVCNAVEDVARLEKFLRTKGREIEMIVLGMSEYG